MEWSAIIQAPMTDDDPDNTLSFDRLILEPILDCVEGHIGGRNETTRARRAAFVAFFDYVAVLRCSEAPGLDELLDCLETARTLYVVALRQVSRTANAYAELRRLAEVMDRLLADLEKGDPSRFSDEEAAACRAVLLDVFDWGPVERLQAFVLARTGEDLPAGLLGKERSELLAHVRGCAEELLK